MCVSENLNLYFADQELGNTVYVYVYDSECFCVVCMWGALGFVLSLCSLYVSFKCVYSLRCRGLTVCVLVCVCVCLQAAVL